MPTPTPSCLFIRIIHFDFTIRILFFWVVQRHYIFRYTTFIMIDGAYRHLFSEHRDKYYHVKVRPIFVM